MLNNLALLSPDQYELLLSCNDSVFDMLKTIKMKTRIQMGKYGSGNWGVMTANAARYYATSAVNMAVMFSSEIFRDSLMNYKGSIHNDAGKEIDREGLLNSILNKQSLVFGVVTGSGIAGLGGGNALGLREEYLGRILLPEPGGNRLQLGASCLDSRARPLSGLWSFQQPVLRVGAR